MLGVEVWVWIGKEKDPGGMEAIVQLSKRWLLSGRILA